MVIESKMPKNKWVKAIQKPAKIIQIMFNRNETTGMLFPVGCTVRPKGARWAMPSFMACSPHGIPIMVKHSTIPPQMYPMQVSNPPKIIQIKLPIKLIVVFLISGKSLLKITIVE